ncbi:hypothetical protein [Hymenobacter sp. CRA2]|nr:hypothetical protein [Hymenobacter sp. CRA2]
MTTPSGQSYTVVHSKAASQHRKTMTHTTPSGTRQTKTSSTTTKSASRQ